MDRYLLAQREYRTGCMVRIKHFIAKMCCLVGGKLYGNYLISGYMAVKLLYVANAVGQLFLLDSFLRIDYPMYGLRVVEQLIRGQDWGYSERFPRVTLCEFEIRYQSRVHNYIVQCVLTINLFNEKIFMFLWFWFIFLAGATSVNFLRWLFRALYWPGHVQYVRKQIRVMDATPREAGTLGKFAENYLRRDGMFIVRLIGMNMGEVVDRCSTDCAGSLARNPKAPVSESRCNTDMANAGISVPFAANKWCLRRQLNPPGADSATGVLA